MNHHPMLDGCWEDYLQDADAALSALTAAAEVGEADRYHKTIMGEYEKPAAAPIEAVQEQINKSFRMGVAFERERCARVAEATITEDNSWADGRARNIAAAIRALKDDNKPAVSDAFGGPFPEEEP